MRSMGGAGGSGTAVGGLAVGAVVLLLWATGMVGGLPGGGAAVRTVPVGPVHPAASSGLEVNPASWTMVAGGSVALRADLTPASDGCIPSFAAISWQLGGFSDLLGSLNGTLGGPTVFASYPYVSGTAQVTAVAFGLEICGLCPRNFSASVTATVTLVPPLSVSDPRPTSDPVLPERPVTFAASLSGGLGPYRVTFDFGDGTNATQTLSTAGPVSVAHAYAAGQYTVRATVADALGEVARSWTEEPIVVAAALAAAILPVGPMAEVGVPFLLSASVVGGTAPVTCAWSDGLGDSAIGPSWSWIPLAPGSSAISLRATDAEGFVTNVSIALEVAPPLEATVLGARPLVGLGQPEPIRVEISGGVAPFDLTVGSVPAGSLLELDGVQESSLDEVLVPSAPGPLWASISVTDRLGVALENVLPIAEVVARPSLTANASGPVAEVGVPFGVLGLAGGTGPFNWSLEATVPLRAATALTPLVAGSALFGWTGVPAASGPALLELSVTDATGAVASENLSLRVVAPLAITLTGSGSNGTVGVPDVLNVGIQGGLGPYRGTLVLPDGTSLPVNASAGGLDPVGWSPRAAGSGTARLVLTDALGATAEANLSLAVAPGGPAAGPAPTPSPGTSPPAPAPAAPPSGPAGSGTGPGLSSFAAGIIVGLLGAGLLGVGWTRWRRRASPPSPSAPAPIPRAALETVRRLVREGDGIDRESLLLMAEEEGVEAAHAQAALDRWVALGKVERREDPGSGATFAWSTAAPEAPRSEAPAEEAGGA
jgi:hypothetical protein